MRQFFIETLRYATHKSDECTVNRNDPKNAKIIGNHSRGYNVKKYNANE